MALMYGQQREKEHKRDAKPERKKKRTGPFRKKQCKFCLDHVEILDYKDTTRLAKQLTERGKMIPSRISGTCAGHQRMVSRAIKRARFIALLPYIAE